MAEKVDWPNINIGGEDWRTVKEWAEINLGYLRGEREKEGSDLRKLDIALGGIHVLIDLLGLPEAIRQDRKREPIKGDDFNIPTPEGY